VTSIALAVSFPAFGNIGDALTAVVENPDSALCTLDTQTADEYHGSCQLLKKGMQFTNLWLIHRAHDLHVIIAPYS
jgi:hypothetical protein